MPMFRPWSLHHISDPPCRRTGRHAFRHRNYLRSDRQARQQRMPFRPPPIQGRAGRRLEDSEFRLSASSTNAISSVSSTLKPSTSRRRCDQVGLLFPASTSSIQRALMPPRDATVVKESPFRSRIILTASPSGICGSIRSPIADLNHLVSRCGRDRGSRKPHENPALGIRRSARASRFSPGSEGDTRVRRG